MGLLFSRIFFRLLSRNKEIYVLKLVSLTVAFSSCILVILFSFHEFTFDRYHVNYAQVFRLLERNESQHYDGNRLSNRIPDQVLKLLRARYQPSTIFGRLKLMREVKADANGIISTQKIHAADREILNVYSFDFINKSSETFSDSNLVACVSEDLSKRLFPKTGAVGQNLRLFTFGDTILYRITAVFSEMPANSHEKIDILIPYADAPIRSLGFDPSSSAVYGRHHNAAEELAMTLPPYAYFAQPIKDIHFGPRVLGEVSVHGDRYSINILIFIVSMIFLLALSTYTNLTTLTLPTRAKEFAVRKLGGSNQSQLLLSFARESASVVVIAIVLSLLCLALSHYAIQSALQINLMQLAARNWLPLFGILLALGSAFLVGPLFIANRFANATPTRLLGGTTITFPKLKQVIIFVQLTISMFLIVVSVVTRRQIDYSLVKEPGQSNDQILYLQYPEGLTLRELIDLRTNWSNPHMIDVIATSHIPDNLNRKDLRTGFYVMTIEPGFKDFFNLQMVNGNWFKANDGDSIVVVNESAVKDLSRKPGNTIGVFRDLGHQFDLPERPTMLTLGAYRPNYLFVKVLEVDIRRSVEFLGHYFSANGQRPKISFMNKGFEQWIMYQDKLNNLSILFTTVALIVSCFAIYALIISIVRDKLKQIAIHKLCGASLMNLTRILAREFAFQTLMVALVAGPITYLVLKELLREFVFSTQVTFLDFSYPLLFVSSVVVSLCAVQAFTLNRRDLAASLKS